MRTRPCDAKNWSCEDSLLNSQQQKFMQANELPKSSIDAIDQLLMHEGNHWLSGLTWQGLGKTKKWKCWIFTIQVIQDVDLCVLSV